LFTGIVEQIGRVSRLARSGPGARVAIEMTVPSSDRLELGESVAVSGVCLTVDKILDGGFEADMSSETLAKSTLGSMTSGARVNLERASKLGGRMGGHLVLGHVDGIGKLVERRLVGDAERIVVSAERALARYFAQKGSIAIDGVSLTVNEVIDSATELRFAVMAIPHTLSRTTLAQLRESDRVNLEVDVLARYVERLLSVGASAAAPKGPEDDQRSDDERLLQKLRKSGYV
jgi:riboflavin synthase